MSMPLASPWQLALAVSGLLAALGAQATETVGGQYNLGTDSSAGATVPAPAGCSFGTGSDVLLFTGSGVNQVGMHSYACDSGGFLSFGTRSSGENTYYVDGSASTVRQVNGDLFSFFVDSGQIGAFGSTAFGAGEYQEARLSIRLTIDGIVWLDDLWQVTVGENGGTTTDEHHDGAASVTSTRTSGSGYLSWSIDGGLFNLAIGAGDHDIEYTMTSLARGRVTSTTVCRGVDNGGFEQALAAPAIVEGPGDFAAYCGAGAQSGDPFPSIARRQAVPEPGSLALLGLGGVLAAGLRRRRT